MPSWLQPESIVLGLDLQGGAPLYEVDRADVVNSMAQNLRDDLRRLLREEKVGVSGGIGVNAHGVQVRLAEPNDYDKIRASLPVSCRSAPPRRAPASTSPTTTA